MLAVFMYNQNDMMTGVAGNPSLMLKDTTKPVKQSIMNVKISAMLLRILRDERVR